MRQFLVVTCLLLAALIEARYSDNLLVTLNHGGGVVGRYMTSHNGRGINAFMNIPYAEAPVGDLRFMDTVTKGGWNGYINNNNMDHVQCVHMDTWNGNKNIVGQEDCLYLNVFVPQNTNNVKFNNLPVIYFINGMGYKDTYGPDYLLDHDVILVTGNYRKGALGFMSTNDDYFTGNYGLKDQVMILKWIQDNIEKFGGNKNMVTIVGGGNDGGVMVGLHLMSDKSKGLFHKAILQSGTQYNQFGVIDNDRAVKNALRLLEKLGCNTNFNNNDNNVFNCIKRKSVYDIVKKYNEMFDYGHDPFVIFGPVIEKNVNGFITKDIYDMKDYHGNNVPVIVGMNTNNGAWKFVQMLNDKKYFNDIQNKFDDVIPHLLNYNHLDHTNKIKINDMLKDFYFKNKNFNVNDNKQMFIDMLTDGWFLSGIDEFLYNRLVNTKNFGNTFVYLFNYRGDLSFTDYLLNNMDVNDFTNDFHNINNMWNNKKYTDKYNFGVCNNDDLLYLFPIFHNTKNMYNTKNMNMNFRTYTDNDRNMQNLMTKLWVDFVTTGNPTNNNDKYKWNVATKYPIDYFRIGNFNGNNMYNQDQLMCGMEKGFFDDRVKFWRKLNNLKYQNIYDNYDKFIKVDL